MRDSTHGENKSTLVCFAGKFMFKLEVVLERLKLFSRKKKAEDTLLGHRYRLKKEMTKFFVGRWCSKLKLHSPL